MSAIFGFLGLILAGASTGLMFRDSGSSDEEGGDSPAEGAEDGRPEDERADNLPPMKLWDDGSDDADTPKAAESGTAEELVDSPPPSEYPSGDGSITSSDLPRPLPGPEVLQGTATADGLEGGEAADQILGGAEGDQLNGHGGADQLWGEAGDDTLSGGNDSDSLMGGLGDDILYGGMGDDALWGDEGDDSLSGGAGADWLFGGAGSDWLSGGEGSDVLVAGSGPSTLDGDSGNDTLIGSGDGGSFLNGQEGDDLLQIGPGDIASGGAGSDRFELAEHDGAMISKITDFDNAEDELVVIYDPSAPIPILGLSVGALPDEMILTVNGKPIAELVGAKGLTLESIGLVPKG